MKNPFKLLFALSFCFSTLMNAQYIQIPLDYPSIQEGIDHAMPGDTIIVAPGTYYERINFNGKDIVLGSQYLLNGNEDFIEQTILDGNLQGAVVTFSNNETNSTELVGFTITRGSHDQDVDFPYYGGGIVCINASPTIRHNNIVKCKGTHFGYSHFGAIYCERSQAEIQDNNIDSTEAYFTQMFGGIVCLNSAARIRRNRITHTFGGYIFRGGGIVADSSDINIEGNIIARGSFDTPPYRCAVKLSSSDAFISKNTLVGDLALNYQTNITLINNIITSPDAEVAISEMDSSQANINAMYNLIQGNWPGSNNIDADPLWVNPDSLDFSLQAYSPCIDTGHPFTLYDPDGTLPDLGAIFYNQGVTSNPASVIKKEIKVYPNPAKGFVQISATGGGTQYRLFAGDGRLLKTGTLVYNTRIPLEAFSPGLYLLQLTTPSGDAYHYRIVKE